MHHHVWFFFLNIYNTSRIFDGQPLLLAQILQKSGDPRHVNTAICNEVSNTFRSLVEFIELVSQSVNWWNVAGGFRNLVLTVSKLTEKWVLRRPLLSRRLKSRPLLCGWYMCMRARPHITRQNCIGCNNHTFGRVIIHFADKVWGKRSNPQWSFLCTAHSAHSTCAEGIVFGHVPVSHNRDCTFGSVKKQRPEWPAGIDLPLRSHLRRSG
jgi:hypothetical protein